MGIKLISYATQRRVDMEQREAADAVNDFGRDPIGESKEEQVCTLHIHFFMFLICPQRYNRSLKAMLLQKKDNASRAPDMGERNSRDQEKKRPTLNELTRFTMVKQIW
jgi:hypothetical protein